RSLGYVFTAKDTAPATPDSYQLDPKDMVVHWEKVQTAVHQHMQGEVAESIRGFEQALAEVPEDIWARHVLSNAYNTYGEYQKAYEMIASIEQRQPDDAGTVAGVGSALLQLGRVEEAEQKFTRALELDPRSGSARLGLAQIAIRRRDEAGALALLDEVIEIDPGSSGPAAYVAIGRLKLRKRELEPAREAFRAALEIDRMHAGAYGGLASVLIEEGQSDAALPYLETALRFQPAQPGTLTTLAQIYRDRGELERAIEFSERALEMSPKFAAAYNNLGRIHRKQGEDEAAFEMYERAIEYSPRFDAAYVNRAQLLLASGREGEAIEAFREAMRANPFNYIALANLGVHNFKDGSLRKAAVLFGRAIRIREDYALAHKYLGLLYAEFDEPAASVRHLERSLELDDAQLEVEKMRFLLAEMKLRVTRDS
ncbi:MAG: tetratricopeptide repeat protein, partial [Deltaproteobacteria bacterium]|nr:tetratricopeptide repeat protein [Deltaproteobacteria bacterium]